MVPPISLRFMDVYSRYIMIMIYHDSPFSRTESNRIKRSMFGIRIFHRRDNCGSTSHLICEKKSHDTPILNNCTNPIYNVVSPIRHFYHLITPKSSTFYDGIYGQTIPSHGSCLGQPGCTSHYPHIQWLVLG